MSLSKRETGSKKQFLAWPLHVRLLTNPRSVPIKKSNEIKELLNRREQHLSALADKAVHWHLKVV